jgi:hypothetical protein
MSTAKDLIQRVDAAALELSRALHDAYEENIRFRLIVQPEYVVTTDNSQRSWGAEMIVVEQAYQVFRDRRHNPVQTKTEHDVFMAEYFSPDATARREEIERLVQEVTAALGRVYS